MGMGKVNIIEGEYSIDDAEIGIVVGRFNELITDQLLHGCVDALARCGIGAERLQIVRVPGAFEVPLALKRLAASGRYAALVAIACVIRGATPHFEYVAGECATGVARVSYDFEVPVGFGVLTVDTVEQAIERAGTKAGNKGADAAMAAVELAGLLRKLGNP